MREMRRKLFHLGFGAFVISLALIPDREYAISFVLCSFLAGLGILSLKLRGVQLPIADELLARLERKGAPPGYGAFWYLFGILSILAYVQNQDALFASLLMLCIADASSSLAGQFGRNRLPHNKNKTFEGSLAFLSVSLVSFFWLGFLAVPFSLIGAFVESLDTRVDDNFLISSFCIVFFFLFPS
ncbi:MAG: hypothetical protein ABIF01_02445 [Candidatus Micrarchaeota archaeon]